jgi:hypothetical protein
MPTYPELRQSIVATLAPDVNRQAVLQLIAHAGITGGTQAAGLDLLTAGGERREIRVVEDVMAWLDAHFADAIAALHAELQRTLQGAVVPGRRYDEAYQDVLAQLRDEFIRDMG